MDNYLLLKLIHILSAVVLVGTGTGIAYFMLMASRTNNVQAIYITANHVILADWIFTTPAVLIQLMTGVLLMNELGYSYTSLWFYWVIALFILVGLCWLPVLRIQYRLREIAKTCLETNKLTAEFNRLIRLWIILGVPAFFAILMIFWLMVFKPFPLV